MYKLIHFIFLLTTVISQSSLTWTPPKEFVTGTISIIQGVHPSNPSITTNITYPSTFTGIPQVILSLSSLQELNSGLVIDISQKSVTEQPTYFIHDLFLSSNQKIITNLKITYASMYLGMINFLYFHDFSLSSNFLYI